MTPLQINPENVSVSKAALEAISSIAFDFASQDIIDATMLVVIMHVKSSVWNGADGTKHEIGPHYMVTRMRLVDIKKFSNAFLLNFQNKMISFVPDGELNSRVQYNIHFAEGQFLLSSARESPATR